MRTVSKRTKRLGTKKKKALNADELNSYKVAYGTPLGFEDVFKNVIVPGIVFAIFGFVQLYYWWLSLIYFGIGCFYGWRVILPKVVKKNYEKQSFDQINQWINNLTLILTDESKTIYRALAIVSERAEGEFKSELKQLESRLYGADNERIRDSFRMLSDKYSDDVIFIRFCEQLEAAAIEGKSNVETLKDIKSDHNDLKERQEYFQRKKDEHFTGMKTLGGLLLMVYLVLPMSAGWGLFFDAYARNITGYVATALYSIVMYRFYIRYMKYYFDNSVLEVDV